MKTIFVPLEDVLMIHDLIIEATGGKGGVRDFSLFHSVLSRPEASFGGEDLYPTLFNKASALVRSLLLNHPFNDADKRTALAATERFLDINGFIVTATQKQKVQVTLDIESKKLNLEKIAKWLTSHTKKTG